MPDTRLQVIVSARDDATRVLKRISNQSISTGNSFTRMAKAALPFIGIAAALGAITLGFRSAIGGAMQFEKEMGNVATLLDTNAENMDKMNKKILDMAKRLPVTISELTTGLYDVRSAGISAGKAMETLEASGRLAVAGLGTTQDAVNLLTSSINVFSKQGYSADEMANILFKTVKAGKTTVSELARAFGMVAPLAGTLEIDLTELQAATAALTTTGMKAAIAQTQLRAGMSNLLKPTKEMKTLMERVGVATAKQLIQTHGLVGGYRELRTASQGNAEMFAKAMGSVEGLNAALFLTGEGMEKFTSIMDDMTNGVDDLSVAFQKQTKASWAQVQMYKNQLNVVMMELGKRILPLLIKGFGFLLTVIEKVRQMFAYTSFKITEMVFTLQALWAAITRNKEAYEKYSRLIQTNKDNMNDFLLGIEEVEEGLDILTRELNANMMA